MRITLTAATLLLAVTLTPPLAVAEPSPCDPHPLTQGHPAWMKMPTGTVDRGAGAPASASNPLMVGYTRVLPAAPSITPAGADAIHPLIHRP